MTRERLENLRRIEGRDLYLQAKLESLPLFSPERSIILSQLIADAEERDTIYQWINSIGNARIINIIALRYAKNARWEEIAEYLGNISASACKKIASRYITASQKLEDE